MKWRLRAISIALALAAMSGGSARGDEGLWTYDKFPSDRVQAPMALRPIKLGWTV